MAEATPASQAGSENTILVISSAIEEARRFIRRECNRTLLGRLKTGDLRLNQQELAGTSAASAIGPTGSHSNGQNGTDSEHDPDLLPWLIENKYYSAQIYFRICDVDEVELWERGTEVILYAFVDSVSLRRCRMHMVEDEMLTPILATKSTPARSHKDDGRAAQRYCSCHQAGNL